MRETESCKCLFGDEQRTRSPRINPRAEIAEKDQGKETSDERKEIFPFSCPFLFRLLFKLVTGRWKGVLDIFKKKEVTSNGHNSTCTERYGLTEGYKRLGSAGLQQFLYPNQIFWFSNLIDLLNLIIEPS